MPEPRTIRVYSVDDEPLIHNIWRRTLPRRDFDLVSFLSAPEALAALEKDPDVDVIVTDLSMPEMDGMALLEQVKARRPEIEVIVVTAHADLGNAVAAVKAGAYQFLAKPFEAQAPELVVRQAVEHKRLLGKARTLELELAARDAAGLTRELVGTSEPMRRLKSMITAAAPTGASVLVLGESGTGKELVAQAIHRGSPRKGRAFVAVNCSALAESLLESELFGHVKGAFTGADATRSGLFEAADGGTIFLDEIGEAPASVQAKLLRVLQEGEVKPVGSTKVARVDVRVIAATNKDLEAEVRVGRFREDLFYRLNVLSLRVPPLRERADDVAALAVLFARRGAARLGRQARELAPDALAALQAWPWPGNVRELENAIERAVVLGHGARVELADLPDAVARRGRRAAGGNGDVLSYAAAKSQALETFERRYLEDVMQRAGGNISEAARLAGLDRSNFRRVWKKYGR